MMSSSGGSSAGVSGSAFLGFKVAEKDFDKAEFCKLCLAIKSTSFFILSGAGGLKSLLCLFSSLNSSFLLKALGCHINFLKFDCSVLLWPQQSVSREVQHSRLCHSCESYQHHGQPRDIGHVVVHGLLQSVGVIRDLAHPEHPHP